MRRHLPQILTQQCGRPRHQPRQPRTVGQVLSSISPAQLVCGQAGVQERRRDRGRDRARGFTGGALVTRVRAVAGTRQQRAGVGGDVLPALGAVCAQLLGRHGRAVLAQCPHQSPKDLVGKGVLAPDSCLRADGGAAHPQEQPQQRPAPALPLARQRQDHVVQARQRLLGLVQAVDDDRYRPTGGREVCQAVDEDLKRRSLRRDRWRLARGKQVVQQVGGGLVAAQHCGGHRPRGGPLGVGERGGDLLEPRVGQEARVGQRHQAGQQRGLARSR